MKLKLCKNLRTTRLDQNLLVLIKKKRVTDNPRKIINSNTYSCRVFLDFSKAFNTVNHNILPTKVEQYGIREVPLKFFASCLTNRQQYVQLGNTVSSTQTITCGIPQSSPLGPILFLIYINGLPNC